MPPLKTSVLLPTTGRPKSALKVVEQIFWTTQNYPLEVIVVCDCDPTTRNAFNRYPTDRLPRRYNVDTGPPIKLIYNTEYRGCSNAWNQALAASDGELIVFAADDLNFREGWLYFSMQDMARHPQGSGLVGFNDGNMRGDGPEGLSTHYLLDRRFIINYLGGVVAWPWYKHSFNDLETCERAKLAGRYFWCEHARVDHYHWTFGTRDKDETDVRMLEGYDESAEIYYERARKAFPNDYDPVITE